MCTTRSGGKGELAEDFLGVLKFFEGKRGDGKNFWRQERGMLIFLDAIEILNICNIIETTAQVKFLIF